MGLSHPATVTPRHGDGVRHLGTLQMVITVSFLLLANLAGMLSSSSIAGFFFSATAHGSAFPLSHIPLPEACQLRCGLC
ncbi:hypothetical protein GCM10027514_02080 [Azotobacter armeniacus]